jgi:hypothetical protein
MAIYKSPVFDSIKIAKDNLRHLENSDYRFQLAEIESFLKKGWKQIYMLDYQTIMFDPSVVIPETMATTKDEVIEYEQRNWDVFSWFKDHVDTTKFVLFQ